MKKERLNKLGYSITVKPFRRKTEWTVIHQNDIHISEWEWDEFLSHRKPRQELPSKLKTLFYKIRNFFIRKPKSRGRSL